MILWSRGGSNPQRQEELDYHMHRGYSSEKYRFAKDLEIGTDYAEMLQHGHSQSLNILA